MIIEKQWHHVKNVLQTTLDKAFAVDPGDTSEFDSLLAHDEINALGYSRNFPHLTCVMCSIEPSARTALASGELQLNPHFKHLDADLALLPATCYKVYLGLRDQHLSQPQIESCIARCFRHEDKALDQYRAFNFTMKEYVYLGTAEQAQAFLERGHAVLLGLFDQLQIPGAFEVANDPFFDASSSVARLAALMPTKRELVYQGHAVSSLNYHRNYFGEKFRIRLDDGFVHTACIAFGLERWVSMFKEHFGTADHALQALDRVQEVP